MLRSTIRLMVSVTASAAAALVASSASAQPPSKGITLTPLGVYRANLYDKAAAEIAAYDPDTARVFVVNVERKSIEVLDIHDPTSPTRLFELNVSSIGSHANSVAVRGGVVAVAVQAFVKTDPGHVAFFDAFGNLLSTVTVGALPDMLTFTPNGRFVLVANEGEPNDAYTIDPEGSVSIIDMRGGAAALNDTDVRTATFTAFNGTTLAASIRVFGPNASVAQDLEPEYIAVSQDSSTAWVTLQENNAMATIDIAAARVTDLVGLGFKDYMVGTNRLDPSDADGTNSIQHWPVVGMYQPDAIASFEHQGKTYLITANEGDVREYAGLPGGSEARRVSSLTLDATAFPTGGALKANSALGRLNVTVFNGNPDADGDFDQLFTFGGRSFSIWTATGTQVFDSGDALERLTAATHPSSFNASNTNNTRDNRSDDKGPEPEGVTVARLFGRLYAFLALERIGGVVVYAIDDPLNPEFVQYINLRNFQATTSTAAAEDLGPEGVLVVKAEDSPTGQPLLILANEVSGTTRLFSIAPAKR